MSNKITIKLLEQVIEGALLASGKTLSISDVRGYFEDDDIIPSNVEIRKIFEKLIRRYKNRGIELKQVATGYRFQVAEVAAPYVVKQWHEKPQKYSRALLETLVLIAYRQPITRGDIEDIRGVSVSSNIIRTLIEREWIRVVGHKDVPGRPSLFATTSKFLDYFNLKSLTELPELSEVKNLEDINPELDFGETLQLPGVAQQEKDPDAEFDGETADLIPATETPISESVEEVSAEDQERMRQEKEAKNKEKELQQELEAREELQSIDRYNKAFEQIIRKPELQTSSAANAVGVNEDDVTTGKSRFAQLADKLEEVIEHSEHQAQEQTELMSEDEVSVDHISMMDAIAEHQAQHTQDVSERDDVVILPEDSQDSTAGSEMSEEDIQAFIQQKLAEQQALLEGKSNTSVVDQKGSVSSDSSTHDDELLKAIEEESTYAQEAYKEDVASGNSWEEPKDLKSDSVTSQLENAPDQPQKHEEPTIPEPSGGGIKNSWDI